MSEETPVVESDSHDENAAPSPAPEVETKTEVEAEASATETPEEVKKPNKVQERINQLTREKHELRQKNAEFEQRLKDLESKPAESKPDLVAPDPDKFDTDQEYQTANAKFYADTALKATDDRIATQDEEVAKQQRQQAIQTKKVAFEANLAEKRGNFEDFEAVAYDHSFMDLDLAEQIFEMEKGPEVAYFLGSNLDEAERIFALSPVQRARELTKLEFQVEALKPKKVSDAPDPIKPLGNSEAVESDPDKMSADEWQKWRNKQVHG